MKTESRNSGAPMSESRKVRKPLMEKKRRARINDSLETLKQILLDSKTTLKESKKNGQRTAKLEKADILEMTVQYLQHLHTKLNNEINKQSKEEMMIKSSESVKMGVTLIPTKLKSGEIVFVMPSNLNSSVQQKENYQPHLNQNVWRPW
ncbi:unnamed protein product [Brassicogethes aeneus]|uniref:BHLH domain-containing protein n=1 Tax=Brassicogethes aeneus TaxID=1431903 RepID=A0A9P0B6J0_BRAAE|nr:unnamed protein product [Brassicogethes aeneus]